jgi:hypothetical protein
VKTEPVNGWAIRHWRGRIYVDTVCRTRRDSIATFQKAYRVSDKTWKDHSKYGVHRAVKVTVTANQ